MDKTRLELHDFTQYTYLSQLAYAPDGRRAAFVAQHAKEDNEGYLADLYVLDVESGAVRRLTSAGDCRSFIWESDRTILFAAARDKKDKERIARGEPLTVLQRIAIDGGEAVEALRLPLKATSMQKMEDGRLAVIAKTDLRMGEFHAMDEAQRKDAMARLEAEKDYKVLEEIPFWFNGKGFIDKTRTTLMLVTMDGQITRVSEETMNVEQVALDGSRVLYAGKVFTDKSPRTGVLHLYDAATGEDAVLVPDGQLRVGHIDFWQGEPVFFGSRMDRHGANQNPELYAVRGGEIVQLFARDEAPGSNVGSDCRLGGGKSILISGGALYYTLADHEDTKLLRLAPDGSAEVLADGWGSVDCFDVHDGHVLAVAMRGLRLQEIYALEGGEFTRLTDFNEAIHAGKTLSEPLPLNIVSDGVDIDGFVMLPVGYDPQKRYPAILDIHGGPKTAFGHVFFHEMQVWANMGYFVFYCNPRGGDGRGDEFADIRGKYGTIDYDDLMRFTDAVLEAYPQIDQKRVGVTGGSYGGFMTNWIIGHTDRFAAAASQRSIANWISKSNTTDIGYSFNADQMLCDAWSDIEKLWFHSPLKYADRCITPTLFIHSDEDYRCWMAEGLQMFTALKVHGCPARLCLFHGENHELSRSGRPDHRIRRLTEMTDWFDKYLG